MLLQQLVSTRKQRFTQSRQTGIGSLGPKIGYYHIIDIEYRQVGKFENTPIAKCYWKQTRDDVFYEDVVFELALKSLFDSYSLTPAEIARYKGCTIHITEVNLSYIIEDGVKVAIAKPRWFEYLENSYFVNQTNIALHLFWGAATNLTDAWNNFALASNIDYNEALFQESEDTDLTEDVPDDYPVEDTPDEPNE